MVHEATRPELKLDTHALPSVVHSINEAFCLAVGKGRVYSFDKEAEFATNHAEEEDDSVLVDGSVPQSAKVDRSAVLRSITLGPDRR